MRSTPWGLTIRAQGSQRPSKLRAFKALKRMACTCAVVSPIMAVLFIDGVDANVMITQIIAPIGGSLLFLLLMASFFTFGGRCAAALRYTSLCALHALFLTNSAPCTQPSTPLPLELGQHL